MRILVTGATGFVGKALVPRLRESGYAVRLAVRRPPPGPEGADAVCVGEIDGATDWTRALDGIDAVVHLAARVHVLRETAADPAAAFLRVNRDGTRALAAAAARAGVRRFVHLSSVKAVADRGDRKPFDDHAEPSPTTPYGRSKREAELALLEAASGSAMETVILRPPLVYGPGVKGNFLALLNACWRRLPLPLGAVRNRRSLIYAGNLADAIERVIAAEGPTGGCYLVCDGPGLPVRNLIIRTGRALGRRGPLLPVPPVVLRLAGEALGRGAAIDRLTEPLEIDDRRFRAIFDWRPPHSFDSGVAATARWFRALQEAGRSS